MIWPKQVTLVSWTQPSGLLCLWQCLNVYFLNLKNKGRITPISFYLLGFSKSKATWNIKLHAGLFHKIQLLQPNISYISFHSITSKHSKKQKNSLKLYRTFAASIMHWKKVKAGKFQDQTASKLSTWIGSQKCKKNLQKVRIKASSYYFLHRFSKMKNNLLYTLVTSRHHQGARDKQTKKQKGNYIYKTLPKAQRTRGLSSSFQSNFLK